MNASIQTKLLLWLGGAAVWLLSFPFFCYWTFPYDRLRDFVVQEAEYPVNIHGARESSGYRLEIDEITSSWLTGLSMSGVRLKKIAENADEKPQTIAIDDATVRFSVFSLLTGSKKVSFDIETSGGEIEGYVSMGKDGTHVVADASKINLKRMGLVGAKLGLPLSGDLTTHLDVTLGDKAADTNGEFTLQIVNFVVGDANAKLKLEGMGDGLTIGRIDAGKLEIAMKVEKGVARIEKFHAAGKDMTLNGTGTVRLGHEVRDARLDLFLSVKFADAFRERDDKTRAIFSLIDMNPQMRSSRTPDGTLQWQILGAAPNIRAVPAGNRPAPH